MTLIDLRMKYKRLTGDNSTPISHDHFADVNYIVWLEEELMKLAKLKDKLIPWEKL